MCEAVIKGLQMTAILEQNKSYSRDWLSPGRVRVKLKQPNGKPVRPDIPSKAVLLVKCAELCAQHPLRPQRLAETERYEEQLFSGGATAAGKGGKGAAGAAGAEKAATKAKGGKKKGKKK